MNHGDYLYLLALARLVQQKEIAARRQGEEYHGSRALRPLTGGGSALLWIVGDKLYLRVEGTDRTRAARAVFGDAYAEEDGLFVGGVPSKIHFTE